MPVLGLAGCHFGSWKKMQVRLHDIMDGSSLARAIHVPTGPLLDTLKMEIKHRNQRKEDLLQKTRKMEKIIEVNG